ncbi:hypothetical protein D3C71_1882860 [compost metagenome]
MDAVRGLAQADDKQVFLDLHMALHARAMGVVKQHGNVDLAVQQQLAQVDAGAFQQAQRDARVLAAQRGDQGH